MAVIAAGSLYAAKWAINTKTHVIKPILLPSAIQAPLHADHGRRMPCAARRRCYVALVEHDSDCACRLASKLSEDRAQKLGTLPGLVPLTYPASIEAAKLEALGLLRGQSALGAVANPASLLLRHGGMNVQHEGVNVGPKLCHDERRLV